MKYLKHFKWHHLSEKIGAPRRGVRPPSRWGRAGHPAPQPWGDDVQTHSLRPPPPLPAAYEQRIKAQKLRAQLAVAKKEAEAYVERAEQAKSMRVAAARKAPGAGAGAGSAGGSDPLAGGGISEAERSNIRRRFRQRLPLADVTLGTRGGRADAADAAAAAAALQPPPARPAGGPPTTDGGAHPRKAGGKAARLTLS